ncbi:glycosyltransferase [Catenovulum agarivorans]|uniref:glycosyltransferase n=1 Tax=Catenovulum agarivorans TaxID=1172192 RepID=UPI001F1DDD8A|nr:glycosyltransferase [Catenovulum agarivorans]
MGQLRQNAFKGVQNLAFVAPSSVPYEKMNVLVPLLSAYPTEVIKNSPERVSYMKHLYASGPIRLVYVGRLDPVKGIDFLLDVLESLSVEYSFVLDVLGSGPLEGELKSRFGTFPWCKFHGFVSSSVVSSYISSADIFCMPSQWAEVYGLGTALALQFGVPVVGSDIGGTSSLVRHDVTGILVEPNNKQQWRDAFRKLFSDSPTMERLRQGAQKHQSEFSDDYIADKYDKLSALLLGA